MGLRCGIVGLPNVGKSTLYNALTSAGVEASNYPFCTIEPNTGVVKVPDHRLDELSRIVVPERVMPAIVEIVDIAGLVAGASQGQGLGNKFLGHIKEVDAILHVVRCFQDENVTHVHGKVDPLHDIDVIETELIFKDLETIDARLAKSRKNAAGKEKEEQDFLNRIKKALEAGQSVRQIDLSPEEKEILRPLFLITAKPVLYVANLAEEDLATQTNVFVEAVRQKALADGQDLIVVCSKIEAEIAELGTLEEKKEFLDSLGLGESGLDRLIRKAYQILGLQTYFTAGVKEVRAWTIKKGDKAPQAAGVIHTDFEKGFIKAETIAYQDFVTCGGEGKAREKGLLRVEGKDYVVQDGDIMHFRFNV